MTDYSCYNDSELTDLFTAGDELAYKEIFIRYSAPLYTHAFNKLRDADEAHDVVQDMFANLWAKRLSLDNQSNLMGYLFTGVRNKIFDLIRHKKIVTSYQESFEAFTTQNYAVTDHLIREKQFAELIEREIRALPPRMQEVFELRRKEYLSNKEIAERMGIRESTVADQMKKALRILRGRIKIFMIIAFLLHW